MNDPSNHVLFFFQAEGGIRDTSVTGVQTCALPILENRTRIINFTQDSARIPADARIAAPIAKLPSNFAQFQRHSNPLSLSISAAMSNGQPRSEEHRVGKECRSRWSPDH